MFLTNSCTLDACARVKKPGGHARCWRVLMLCVLSVVSCRLGVNTNAEHRAAACESATVSRREISDGQVLAVWCELENGRREGVSTRWYYDRAEVQEVVTYRDGQLNGPTRAYHRNGRPWYRGWYVDDLREGDWSYWNLSGMRTAVGRFARDVETGTWTYWHRDGSLRSIGAYKDGEESGPWLFWYPGGGPWASGSYANGHRTGFWMRWRRSGKPLEAGRYCESAGQEAALLSEQLGTLARWHLALLPSEISEQAKVGTWFNWDEDGSVHASQHVPAAGACVGS